MRSLVLTSLAAIGAAALFACGSDTEGARDTSTTLPDGGGPDAIHGSDDAAAEPDFPETASVSGVPVEDVCRKMAQQICAFLTGCSQEVVDGLWAIRKTASRASRTTATQLFRRTRCSARTTPTPKNFVSMA